jgi:putative transposase
VFHTYAQNVIHVVFSTKDRRKLMPNEFRPQMWAYAAGICKKLDILVLAVGGMEDHIHLLVQIPPTLAVANAVLAIKSNSSRWANEEGHKFAWQQGYGAFSVSSSIVPSVIRYIENQEAHHKRMSFDAGISSVVEKTRSGIRFEICVRLGAAPTALEFILTYVPSPYGLG